MLQVSRRERKGFADSLVGSLWSGLQFLIEMLSVAGKEALGFLEKESRRGKESRFPLTRRGVLQCVKGNHAGLGERSRGESKKEKGGTEGDRGLSEVHPHKGEGALVENCGRLWCGLAEGFRNFLR